MDFREENQRSAASGADVKVQPKEEGKESVRAVGAQLRQVGEEAKQAGMEAVEERREAATRSVASVGAALRDASDRLERENNSSLAGYVSAGADAIEELKETLSNKKLSELVDDAERFMRRRPEIAYGAMFVVGLGIARFLKSSSSRSARADSNSLDEHGELQESEYSDLPRHQTAGEQGEKQNDYVPGFEPFGPSVV